MEAFGRVDFLVNNAGTNPVFGPIADLDLNVARKVFETNVVSALGFAQQTWHAWQKENGGAIVNIASVAGLSASPFIGAYGISKAAMVNLTAAAGARVRARGAGQRDRPGRGEDEVRAGALRGPRGGGGRRLPARPARRALRHRRRRRVPDLGTRRTGSPARRSSSTAGSSSTPARLTRMEGGRSSETGARVVRGSGASALPFAGRCGETLCRRCNSWAADEKALCRRPRSHVR